MTNLGIRLRHVIDGAAVMDSDWIAHVGYAVVILKEKGLINVRGNLFNRAIGNNENSRISHRRNIHCPGSGYFINILKELNDAFSTNSEEMVTEFGVLEIVDVQLVTSKLQGKVLKPPLY